VRGFIGVAPDDLSKEVAEAIGLGKASGSLIRSVSPGGAAAKAGIEAGDVITKIDGKQIEKSTDLRRVIAGIKPGAKVSVQVFRRGAYKDLSMTVGEMPDDRAQAAGEPESKGAAKATALFGLTVADLSEAQKRELKVSSGVRVETASGVAARAGLRQGDLILSVDNTEVNSAKQFQAVLAKLDKAKVINLLVRREDVVSFVLLRPAR
jgi:serine protease Do